MSGSSGVGGGGGGGTSGPSSFNQGSSTFAAGPSYGSSFAGDIIRKPSRLTSDENMALDKTMMMKMRMRMIMLSRLEALPSMDRKTNQKKKSVPMLNTMGTF